MPSTSSQGNSISTGSSRRSRPGASNVARGEASEAAQTLRSALARLARACPGGRALRALCSGAAARLEERRTLALEERIEADLELGRSAELVSELERIVGEHPHRERPLAQLMRALYRAGRQAEALAAYQAGRRRLADELGLEPGPELQDLQRKILDHDPVLAAARPPPALEPAAAGSAPPRKRRWLHGGRLAALGAAAAAVIASVMADRARDRRDGCGEGHGDVEQARRAGLGCSREWSSMACRRQWQPGMARSGSRNRAKDG